MEHLNSNKLPIIYGVYFKYPTGVLGWAVDGQTGEVLESHFCSSDCMAKSDLGFSDKPVMDYIAGDMSNVHSTVYFHAETRKTYSKKYPDGYTLTWMGFWEKDTKVKEFIKEKQSNKLKALGIGA